MVTELKNRVKDDQIVTKLDLKNGFHFIRIRKGDEWKTPLQTCYGLYEYKIMLFGLVNPPATSQTIMNKILQELRDDGVVVYMDDILIYSKDSKD